MAREQDAAEEEQDERTCLICGRLTRYAHMEVDVCRACTVFYRRVNKMEKEPVCKTGLKQCDLTLRGNFCCKGCRINRFRAVLSDSRGPLNDTKNELMDDDSPSSSSTNSMQSSHLIQTAAAPEPTVIGNLRRGHSVMNAIRRASELSTRSGLPDKDGIIADGMVLIPATYSLLNQNTRILISSMFEFASTSFEEFKTLEHNDQWLLIRNFYPFISVLDSEYRMAKQLPEQETMIFASYGSYIDHDTVPLFFSDTSNDRNRDDGTRFLVGHLEEDTRQMRARMKRWNPSEDEYLAFVGICFWSLDKVNVSDSVHRIAENYRRLLFLELDKLYRETMGLGDYASRMGEAVMFISSIQGAFFEMRSKLGVLKLLDVIGEEMLMAQLHQA